MAVDRSRLEKMEEARARSNTACRVPEVESLPCGDDGATHLLANRYRRDRLFTVCVECGRSWADLDAEARRS